MKNPGILADHPAIKYLTHVCECAEALQDPHTPKDIVRNMVIDIAALEKEAMGAYKKNPATKGRPFKMEMLHLSRELEVPNEFSGGIAIYQHAKEKLDEKDATARSAAALKKEAGRVEAEIARRGNRDGRKQR